MAVAWHVVGASVAGTKHQRDGTECEDAWSVASVGDVTLCSIADGAGSAPRAAEGARAAVDIARDSLEELACDSLGRIAGRALLAAARGLESLARQHGTEVSDFNTTLTVAALRGSEIAVAQVGDCIAVLHHLSRHEVLAYPEREKRFVEETEFLGTHNAKAAHISTHDIPIEDEPVDFALSTDGLAPLLLDRWVPPIPHDPFFDSLFRAAREDRASKAELESFLESPDVCARTDDDKTLVLATRIR